MTKEEVPNTILPPAWLDKALLTKALREGLEEPELQISSFSIKPATAVGDNYASIMFRITFSIVKSPTSAEEHLSVVAKTLPQGKNSKLMETMDIFNKEAVMMQRVLPVMHEVLSKVYPDQLPLSAKFIWYGSDPEPIIIIQDLKELGYENADRMNGLDMHMTGIVLENLAKFHASSLYILQNRPELLEIFQENIYDSDFEKDMLPFFNSAFDGLIEEVSSWDDVSKETLERLKASKNFSKFLECAKSDEDDLKILQHGDCWINNFMFANIGKDNLKFRFCDFQICHLNSVGIDLNYFLFTSPCADIRVSKIDENLALYHKFFMEAVDRLGVKLPKPFALEDLQKAFTKAHYFGIFAFIAVYPITVCPPKNAPKFDDFFEESNSKRYLYQSEMFKKVFKLVIPYLIEKGAM